MKSATTAERRVLSITSGADEPAVRVNPSPGSEVRITVALIPEVVGGLTRLQRRTSLSKTDITNRAISSYEFFDEHLHAGRELIIRNKKTGETLLVRFL
jgi:hypothetical protein